MTSSDGTHAVVIGVDDDPAIASLIALVLRRQGMQVFAFEDPRQALALLAVPAQCVDLLLTDVVMPYLSGFELAAAARVYRPMLPVLFASATFSADDVGDRATGDDGFIAKPFLLQELVRKVRWSLRGLAG